MLSVVHGYLRTTRLDAPEPAPAKRFDPQPELV
jgi:hypothetical protein